MSNSVTKCLKSLRRLFVSRNSTHAVLFHSKWKQGLLHDNAFAKENWANSLQKSVLSREYFRDNFACNLIKIAIKKRKQLCDVNLKRGQKCARKTKPSEKKETSRACVRAVDLGLLNSRNIGFIINFKKHRHTHTRSTKGDAGVVRWWWWCASGSMELEFIVRFRRFFYHVCLCVRSCWLSFFAGIALWLQCEWAWCTFVDWFV